MAPVQPVSRSTSRSARPSTKSPIPSQRLMRLYLRTSGESGGATVLVVAIPVDYCIQRKQARDSGGQGTEVMLGVAGTGCCRFSVASSQLSACSEAASDWLCGVYELLRRCQYLLH